MYNFSVHDPLQRRIDRDVSPAHGILLQHCRTRGCRRIVRARAGLRTQPASQPLHKTDHRPDRGNRDHEQDQSFDEREHEPRGARASFYRGVPGRLLLFGRRCAGITELGVHSATELRDEFLGRARKLAIRTQIQIRLQGIDGPRGRDDLAG
jgi:hypothetical protein